ncbi:hypothetical protein EDE15_4647 [Edaphobacter aggregans]|jgi:hypothetical protein|uniref:Uncharacterized protein n=1 Tax=Edaphobacter aggregans TaxID=570835 RepID=A0A3R9P0B6_9BACT|nr:hypothetical protein [Edaphobacter aggregans]RSL19034.1 hypothetical protein EDE15_4647 [Edaphobacter aggregans]
MDVMGGCTLAIYVGRTLQSVSTIKDFQAAIKAGRADVTTPLEATCGKTIQECAREDTGRLSSPAANEAFYAGTHTYINCRLSIPRIRPQLKTSASLLQKQDIC